MSRHHIQQQVERYYSAHLREHGATPQGVDWRDESSQRLRFDQLMLVIQRDEPYSVLDFGCGYGALAQVLLDSADDFNYVGFDISEAMLDQARRTLSSERVCFESRAELLPEADYVLASGILNVKLETDEQTWRDYTLGLIADFNHLSRRGFAFNMLTSYSDEDRKRPDLYYGDPCFFFDFCKTNLSRDVALLHDYGLYEYTILVRK